MPKISFSSKGSFDKADKFLQKMSKGEIFRELEGLAKEGVAALKAATPVDSGITASSWDCNITQSRGSSTITWTNSNKVNGSSIAIMLQYGHGTGTGGYVQGQDYINPAIRPVFDKIATRAWKAVTTA